MIEHPILFNAEMVRAILSGAKTQTRRAFAAKNGGLWPNRNDLPGMKQIIRECKFGQVGDRLWVREAFAIVPRTAYARSEGVQQTLRPDDPYNHDAAIYREGWNRSNGGIRWRPSIHMPRWASRITLEITGVRVERLHDISEADAQAEGCALECMTPTGDDGGSAIHGPGGYIALWESINCAGSWDANPWVWVIEFKRVEAA